MKNFEISAYGVEEMNSQEMKSVDGGWLHIILKLVKYLASAVAGESALNYSESNDNFNAGISAGFGSWGH